MGGSRRIPWLVFVIGVLAVVDVLGWVTWRMIRLEEQQARTRAEAARQEAIGRALWRMDSIVLPILAVESARPYFEYQAFYAANRPFDQMWEPITELDTLVPSPLLGEPGDFIQLHFERTADGRLTSPQAPAQGQPRDAAIAAGVPPALLSMADLRLYELDRVDSARLAARDDAIGLTRAEPLDGASSGLALDRRPQGSPPPESGRAATTRSPGSAGRRSILNPFGSDGEQAANSFNERSLAGSPETETSSIPLDELSASMAAPPPPTVDSRATTASHQPVQREGIDPTTGSADPRQDLLARQQAATYAQNYNDAGRSNRSRQYDARPTGQDELAMRSLETEQRSAQEHAGRELASGPIQPAPLNPGSTAPSAAAASEGGEPSGRQFNQSAAPGEPRTQTATPVERHSGTLEQPAAVISGPGNEAVPDENLLHTLRDQAGQYDRSAPTPGWLDGTRTRMSSPLALPSAVRPDSGALTPAWRGDASSPDPALVLTRTVTVNDESREQGVWIDWPALRRALESSVSDLFPLAEVRPFDSAATRGAMQPQRLATIPVVLIPGPLAEGILPTMPAFWTPTRWTLLVGWIAVAIAVIAIGIVLRKAIDLGERRGRFVSAVTHELRTPLTTFRLYSQMLAAGTIADESKRARYAQTLDRESQRLTGIVESVLEYARLGRRASGKAAARQRVDVAGILDRARPTLAGRCERAGMELVWPEPADIPAASIVADPDKLERILLNLVDNACKYAAEAEDRRIVVATHAADGRVVFSVRDHGPGIPEPERRRVFNAFHRAKHHDQSASPGLGLGLALSRGLAREMGGDLRLVESATPGAVFELSLPVA